MMRRGGGSFSITFKKSSKSPFDISSINTLATAKDILDAVRIKVEKLKLAEPEAVIDYSSLLC